MAPGSSQRFAIYHRHAADPERASLAAQEAQVRAYLAAHPEWKTVPVLDSGRPQPSDRPETTGPPLPASTPDTARTTDRRGRTRRYP